MIWRFPKIRGLGSGVLGSMLGPLCIESLNLWDHVVTTARMGIFPENYNHFLIHSSWTNEEIVIV